MQNFSHIYAYNQYFHWALLHRELNIICVFFKIKILLYNEPNIARLG